jgi:hypothetical protein
LGSLPADVREALRANFEEGMQLIHDRISALIPELMRQMAIYFIQFRPASGRTLYCRLIDCIRELGLLDRVVFSTLNYECVLEFSLLAKGIAINYFEQSTRKGVPVWKLHGSCNMFATGLAATPGVTYTSGVTFDGGLEALLDSNEVIERWLDRTALAPAMCLYMRGKPLNISPAVIKQVQSMWTEAVHDCKAIFCIGANPYVEDSHVWGPIASSRCELWFVGGQTSFEKWAGRRRADRSDLLGIRFEIAFGSLLRRLAEYAAY